VPPAWRPGAVGRGWQAVEHAEHGPGAGQRGAGDGEPVADQGAAQPLEHDQPQGGVDAQAPGHGHGRRQRHVAVVQGLGAVGACDLDEQGDARPAHPHDSPPPGAVGHKPLVGPPGGDVEAVEQGTEAGRVGDGRQPGQPRVMRHSPHAHPQVAGLENQHCWQRRSWHGSCAGPTHARPALRPDTGVPAGVGDYHDHLLRGDT
jgi:hypothetical protein